MHIKSKYSWLKHADFMLIDLLSLVIAYTVSYRLKFGSIRFMLTRSWLSLLVILIFIDLVITLLTSPYSGILRRSFYEQIAKTGILAIYNFLISCVIFYLMKIGTLFSREMLIEMYIIYFVLALLLQYIWKKLIVSGVIHTRITQPIRLYIVGSKADIPVIEKNVNATDFTQYEIIGSCDEREVSSLTDYVIENNIDEVLIAENLDLIPKEVLLNLVNNGIGVHIDIDTLLGFQTESQQVSKIGVNKTLAVGTYTFTPRQMIFFWVKRLFDIICGLIGCALLIPITLVVKIAYLATGDKNPIFYTQQRVGKNGKIIHIYKFRSMVPDADRKLEELLQNEEYRKEWEESQKLHNDPRVTKVGKFLRRTSLDEFPQFINVLKGDMSLVGPRPLIEGELESHNGLKLYQQVKPGITGWWACNGRSNIDYTERLDLEYHYVKHCSLYLDLLCILRTIIAVFRKDGAE